MAQNPMRTLWMLLFALLLLPTGLAMATSNFALAGVCVVMLVAVRIIGLPKQPPEEDAENDPDDD